MCWSPNPPVALLMCFPCRENPVYETEEEVQEPSESEDEGELALC